MRILVIGGTGHFGRATVQKLVQRGDDVTVFSRGNVLPEFIDDVRHIQGDRNDRDFFYSAFKKSTFDAVIDNIAYTSEDIHEILRTFKNNIGHYLVSSSGIVCYTKDIGMRLFSEDEVDYDVITNNSYADGKLALEKALLSDPEISTAMPFTIFRPTIVEGPFDPHYHRTWYWVQRILDGGPVLIPRTNPSTLLRHVYTEDVADIYLMCLDNPKSHNKVYHVAGRDIFDLADYVSLIAEILGKQPKLVFTSYKEVRQYPGLSEFKSEFVELRQTMDIARAMIELKWEPTPIQEWLPVSLNWMLNMENRTDSAGYSLRKHEIAFAEKYTASYKIVQSPSVLSSDFR